MRCIVLIALIFTSGCSATLRPVSITSSPNYASLSFRDADGKSLGEADGLWFVDNYRFKAPQSRVYIAPGRRSVGYQCPGWMSWDDFASLQYIFEAGKNYEMVCEHQGPVIYPLPG